MECPELQVIRRQYGVYGTEALEDQIGKSTHFREIKIFLRRQHNSLFAVKIFEYT